MIFSRSTEYAIRVLVYLVMNTAKNQKLGGQKLAGQLQFPEHFLGKILQKLARRGYIASVKGPNGGFYATERTGKVTLLEIVDLFDGLQFFNTCGLGLNECDEERPCPIHNRYQIIKGDLYKLLSEKSVDSMKNDLENGIAFMQFQLNGADNVRDD